jgi:hypothetical protein
MADRLQSLSSDEAKCSGGRHRDGKSEMLSLIACSPRCVSGDPTINSQLIRSSVAGRPVDDSLQSQKRDGCELLRLELNGIWLSGVISPS